MIGQRWGVSDQEVARHFPCDDIVPDAGVAVWRGVTIDAPAGIVWRWLRQVRLAPYSYDWIDNFGRRSPRQLLDVADPRPGDPFSRSGSKDFGQILTVTPGEQLTARVMGAVMSYVIAPESSGTRLLLKVVMPQRSLWSLAVAAGDWPMARRQLLNFKRLAENR